MGGPAFRAFCGGWGCSLVLAATVFNVWSERKRVEKLRYLHRNPVKRGLVALPEEWRWSSFRHYVMGEESAVEIESQWTARKRERMGVFLTVHRCAV